MSSLVMHSNITAPNGGNKELKKGQIQRRVYQKNRVREVSLALWWVPRSTAIWSLICIKEVSYYIQ